jgi:hypothetical protein
MSKQFTTAQVAEICGVPVWRIQRLFSLRLVPDVERFAGKRAIPAGMVPRIIDVLRERDWLPAAAEVAAHE